jgi:hypothetical protein
MPRADEGRRIDEREVEEVLVDTVELTLGERHDFEQLDASGERLGAARHCPERCRAGEQPAAVVVTSVQFSLDGLQQLGHVLVLVDANR